MDFGAKKATFKEFGCSNDNSNQDILRASRRCSRCV